MADRAEVNLEITHDNILAGYSSPVSVLIILLP